MNINDKSTMQPASSGLPSKQDDAGLRRDSQLSFVSINHGKLDEQNLEMSVDRNKDGAMDDMYALTSIQNTFSFGLFSSLIAIAYVVDNFNQIKYSEGNGEALTDSESTIDS